MQTLSYGYKKPETNDKGPVVFPAMEDNIDQINDHNHDGANSAKLTTASFAGVPQSVSAAGWVSLGGGNYRQAVTMLPGYDFDEVSLSIRLSTGHYLTPTIEKISDTQFYVYSNDNTISLVILYGV